MTVTFDVWADSVEDASGKCAEVFFDMPHEWNPTETEIVVDEERFYPINEKD